MADYPIGVSIDDARKFILENCKDPEIEEIFLCDALHRTIAQDIVSIENIPPFKRSPYDGYAFRACDTVGATKENPKTFEIIEEIPAGFAPTKEVGENQAVKILTGAPVPFGADAIEMYEAVDFDDRKVALFKEYKPNTNIVPEGEDIRENEKVIDKGTTLTPGHLGILAGLGYSKIRVYRKPKLAIISTGSELVPVESNLEIGKIRNSSAYVLSGFFEKFGGDVSLKGIIEDDDKMIGEAIKEAAESNDIVVTTGGISVGDYDMVLRALDSIGAKVLFWKLNMKPGGAFAVATYNNKLVICLSGNPSSAVLSMIMTVSPAIKYLSGREDIYPKKIRVKLARDFVKKSPSRRFFPGNLEIKDGHAYIDFTTAQGNGMINPLFNCDLLGEIEAGSPALNADTIIDAWMLF